MSKNHGPPLSIQSPGARTQVRWGNYHILYNPARLDTISLEWFEPEFWLLRNAVRQRFQGRGQVLAVDCSVGPAVLRRYRRGGLVARLISDRYLYSGAGNSRSFREFELLGRLFDAGLPVPEPLAALCARRGVGYRAALLTHEIQGAQVLADIAESLSAQDWAELRATLSDFFTVGLNHPDLNARNVLRDSSGAWFLIDFDKAKLGSAPASPTPMINRLRRSFKRLGLQVDASALEF